MGNGPGNYGLAGTIACQPLQLKSLVLCKQFRDLCVYSLFSGQARFLIPLFYQFFDLMLEYLRFRFRLSAFTYLVFIIHIPILLYLSR
jgi:hypothetical protein